MSESLEQATEAQLLQALLATRDIPCPVCAYSLRRITSANCPECGAQLDLRVGSTDLKLGPWLVALLGLALPAGFVGVYALIGLFYVVIMLVTAEFQKEMGMLVAPLAVTGCYAFLLWRLIRKRRRFWSMPRRTQRRSALLYAVFGPGGLIIGFFVIMLIGSLMY